MKNKIFKSEALLPTIIFLFFSITLIYIWNSYQDGKTQEITLKTELMTELVATHFEEHLDTHLEIMKLLRREWLNNNVNTPLEFERVVLPLIQSFPGFQAINYINPAGIISWVQPVATNLEAKDKDLHDYPVAAETFILAETTGADCATQALDLLQGGHGFATYFPLIREGRIEGYLNGVFKIDDFIQYYIKQGISRKYNLYIHEDGRVFYNLGNKNNDRDYHLTRDYPISLLDRKWNLSLSPKPELKALKTAYLNQLIPVLIILFSGAFSYVIRLLIIKRKELYKSEGKYRNLFEKSDDAVLIIKNGIFVDCNQATVKMLRYNDKQELLNTHPSKLSPETQPDGRSSYEKADEMMNIALKKGSHRFEWDHKKADGEVFPVEVLLTAIPGEDGIPFIHTVWRNITDRKQAEQLQSVVYQISKAAHSSKSLNALYKSIHKSLSHVLDVTNFYIAYYDESVNLLSFPYYRDEKDDFPISARPLGRGLTAYIMKTDTPLLLRKKKIEEYARKGEIEVAGTLPELWMGAPLKVGTRVIGAVAVNSYVDPDLYTESDLKILTFVSEQIAQTIEFKQALTDLEVEKTYLDELFTNAPEAVALVTTDNTVLHINQEFIALFGYTEKECLKNNIDDLLVGHDYRRNAQKYAQEVAQGKRVYIESKRKKKDGTLIPVSILGSPINYKDGVLAVYVVYRDISDRKQAEARLKSSERTHRLLSEQLTQANLLKETLLDVISHDLKNPAGVILGFSELLEEGKGDNEIVTGIRDSSKNLIQVIDNVSTLSKVTLGENIELKLFDLVPLIEQISKEYESQLINKGLQMTLDLPDSLKVRANPIIAEVFKNYLSNALKYAADGKQLIIKAAAKADMVSINFIDRGATIPRDKRVMIFERGYQLEDEEKKGRGLGLAIVKQIADAHQAEVGVLPNKPKGNIFFLKIPVK